MALVSRFHGAPDTPGFGVLGWNGIPDTLGFSVLGWKALVVLASLLLAIGCGGTAGSSSSTSSGGTPSAGQNVQPVSVTPGITGNYVNGLFTSATICVPGSNACQTIDNLLVDTGSIGVRIFAPLISTSLSLPRQTLGGAPLGECVQFLNFLTWGPVVLADVKLAGEQASSLPVQIMADPTFPAVPQSCQNTGLMLLANAQALGANGILGVGSFPQDCGGGCAVAGPSNPNLYFSCPAAGCQPAAVPVGQQVQNPVSQFASDNNGVVIQLPALTGDVGSVVQGSLIFGIGTQSNNGLGSATVLTLDSLGNFTTQFQGNSFSNSFIDSGSNGIFFLDTRRTGIPVCTTNKDFYCPTMPQTISATNVGVNGASTPASFPVGNADALFNASPSAAAFDNVAGPFSKGFDWGLPFFYGRTVFSSIQGQGTPAGTGAFVAY